MYLSNIKIRNHPVLKDIDIPLINPNSKKPYSIVAFVGENGSGKTSILRELFNYDKSQYIVDKEGLREDTTSFLLMHAMGPNVAGVIGSAVAAGVLLLLFL